MSKTTILCILDGWGYRKETKYNAITEENNPCWFELIRKYPYSLLNTSGEAVGLPESQMGNSEVGHMNIGSGRIISQDLVRINQEIENKTIEDNPRLQAFAKELKSKAKIHIIGLFSKGGVPFIFESHYSIC